MNKKLIVVLLSLWSLSACTEKFLDYAALEESDRATYLATNNIGDQYKLASGMYFIPIVTNTQFGIATDQYTKLIVSTWLTNGKRVSKAETMYYQAGTESIVSGRNTMAGFNQGLAKMHKGDKARFIIPSSLAYGGNAYGDIPAYSTLIYEVEVVSADLELDETLAINDYITKVDPDLHYTSNNDVDIYFKKTVTLTDEDLTLPEDDATVSVAYTGYFLTGNPFDKSSSDLSITIGGSDVVSGFEEAVKLLKVGESCKVLIPSEFAYGSSGSSSGTTIPPFTPLIFEITRTY